MQGHKGPSQGTRSAPSSEPQQFQPKNADERGGTGLAAPVNMALGRRMTSRFGAFVAALACSSCQGDIKKPLETPGSSAAPLDCKPETISSGRTLVRHLTAVEYRYSVEDLLGIQMDPAAVVDEDNVIDGFRMNAGLEVSSSLLARYRKGAESAATLAVERLDSLLACKPTAGEETCAREFLASFLRRGFRRPVAPADTGRYMALYMKARTESHSDFKSAMRLVLTGVLQSPYFLRRYR